MERTIRLKSGEEILYTAIFHRDISKTTIALNIIANCVSESMGTPTDTYRVTLTNERLFIEVVDTVIGDVISSTSIPLDEIKSFDIEYKEEKEYIFITTNKDKVLEFTYDATKDIDIPLEMKKIMNK